MKWQGMIESQILGIRHAVFGKTNTQKISKIREVYKMLPPGRLAISDRKTKQNNVSHIVSTSNLKCILSSYC